MTLEQATVIVREINAKAGYAKAYLYPVQNGLYEIASAWRGEVR